MARVALANDEVALVEALEEARGSSNGAAARQLQLDGEIALSRVHARPPNSSSKRQAARGSGHVDVRDVELLEILVKAACVSS